MVVVGLGTDIIEIDRIAEVFRRNPRFGPRIFTSKELGYCLGHQNCFPHLAARFAAKEAVAKALGRPFSWQDVEISNNSNGKPEVYLHGQAKEFAVRKKIIMTMSHSHAYATAVALVMEDT